MVSVTGGDKLGAALRKISDNLGSDGKTVRVGFLEGATYPDGKSVAEVAALNEYGHMVSVKNADGERESNYYQLPRPFFRNMIAKHKAEWPAAIANLLVASGYNGTYTLLQVGEGIAGQLRQSIIETNDPPLAESTIAKKGFSKPLVDTGHMLNSIDYEVES